MSPTATIEHRTLSCDAEHSLQSVEEELSETVESGNWSSDYSNTDDEDHIGTPVSIFKCSITKFYMWDH